jgi:hypothetical protein
MHLDELSPCATSGQPFAADDALYRLNLITATKVRVFGLFDTSAEQMFVSDRFVEFSLGSPLNLVFTERTRQASVCQISNDTATLRGGEVDDPSTVPNGDGRTALGVCDLSQPTCLHPPIAGNRRRPESSR